MKRLFSLLVLISAVAFFSYTASAQEYEDVIYKRNGSFVRGTVMGRGAGRTIQIQTRDGKVFAIDLDDISRIAREKAVPDSLQSVSSDFPWPRFNKPKGYLGLVRLSGAVMGLQTGAEVGLQAGASRYSLTMVNGYRFLPQFAVGFGTGVSYTQGYQELMVPVYLHLRSDFLDRKVSPYVSVSTGYNISFKGFSNGVFIYPGAGVSFNVGKLYRMTAGIDIFLDNVGKLVSYSMNNPEITVTELDHRVWSAGFAMSIGFSF